MLQWSPLEEGSKPCILISTDGGEESEGRLQWQLEDYYINFQFQKSNRENPPSRSVILTQALDDSPKGECLTSSSSGLFAHKSSVKTNRFSLALVKDYIHQAKNAPYSLASYEEPRGPAQARATGTASATLAPFKDGTSFKGELSDELSLEYGFKVEEVPLGLIWGGEDSPYLLQEGWGRKIWWEAFCASPRSNVCVWSRTEISLPKKHGRKLYTQAERKAAQKRLMERGLSSIEREVLLENSF